MKVPDVVLALAAGFLALQAIPYSAPAEAAGQDAAGPIGAMLAVPRDVKQLLDPTSPFRETLPTPAT
jgi:hypothetical protein